MEVIHQANAKSILDVGVGFGKWGVLIREYFDLRPHKKKGFEEWSIQLDGIEVHEQYITPVHKYIYNNILIGEALKLLSAGNLYYELIIALDIVEHFTKKDGLEFIKLCRNRGDTVLINTPNIYFPIEKEFFNDYMQHKSGWDADDFITLGARYVWQSGIYVLAVFTERDFNLPRAGNIKDQPPDDVDIIKVKELINMYYCSSQFRECIDACEKYTRYFPHDNEIRRLATLCSGKIDRH
jgi:hypothetical protein